MTETLLPRNGETYFFRDQGQFDLLRLRLLPELIARRQDTKNLRLWSAGCSSGEEAYSLAILLDRLLPERGGWHILILGSDIDEAALDRAREGHYGPWSFRMAPPALQQRYFQRKRDTWMLAERIRDMVTFRRIDLIDERFPNPALRDMDLILCRNLFIYFDAPAVTLMANKLAATLSDGGYLMTGHTELIGHPMQHLQCRLFSEGVVYQRIASMPAAGNSQPARIAPLPTPAVLKRTPYLPPAAMPCAEDLLAGARAFADLGEYEQARQVCQQALTLAPLASAPHLLLAQLAQLKGDFEQARHLLEKTLYLDPRSVAAHLELAALCERAENLPRALTLRRAALDIIRALPGDTVIEPYETSAAEIVQWLAR